VLIIVDAARSDVLNPSGKNTDLTFLNNLFQKNSIQFIESVYSVCPVTYCGILGILGSSYWDGLSKYRPQLQDYLTELGYSTHFFLSGDHTRYHGLSTMFGNNISSYYDGTKVDGNPNDDDNVIKWLRSIEVNNKSFLYLHFMSMHAGGVIKEREKLNQISTEGEPALNERFRLRYKFSAIQIDNYIRQVFSILQEKKILDNAVIIISSDHGEFLGEHGSIGHAATNFPFDSAIHIPLILFDRLNVYPDRNVASQVDIAPTFVKAINGQIPENWDGVALQVPNRRCAVRSDTDSYQAYIGFVENSKYKYIKYLDKEFFFNLTMDPTEKVPINDEIVRNRIREILKKCFKRESS
jgi:membrane-anchored protein YejM (alkaline phosphatase superfamily)